MMNVPTELRYTKTHEWVRLDKGVATIGITDFAQEQLGDLTYVELPTVGDNVEAQSEVAVVESVKAAADIYAPVAGTIAEINKKLMDQPELVNSDPFGDGWLFKLRPDDASEIDMLLDADQYEDMIPEAEE
ncbi:MAG: glycine cleavage system protein GcvH [Verrucomicrobia bacterium]|nr:MAG: glycine cleavage system protein GcvH [Verrucomicrobiota bacterium]